MCSVDIINLDCVNVKFLILLLTRTKYLDTNFMHRTQSRLDVSVNYIKSLIAKININNQERDLKIKNLMICIISSNSKLKSIHIFEVLLANIAEKHFFFHFNGQTLFYWFKYAWCLKNLHIKYDERLITTIRTIL